VYVYDVALTPQIVRGPSGPRLDHAGICAAGNAAGSLASQGVSVQSGDTLTQPDARVRVLIALSLQRSGWTVYLDGLPFEGGTDGHI